MKKLEIIVRPERLDDLKAILNECDAHGLMITNIMGYGIQRGHKREYNGIDLSGVTIKYLSKEESIKRTINLREKLERAPKRKKDQIQKQIDRYGDVMVNSSNLFRHLRDSIAHNNYNIDYSKYINTRKLDDIIITFRTYEKYTDELDFEVEISVKEIKRLVKELQNSINLSIELSDEGKNSEVSFLREALVFRNLGLEDIEKESISRKEEER